MEVKEQGGPTHANSSKRSCAEMVSRLLAQRQVCVCLCVCLHFTIYISLCICASLLFCAAARLFCHFLSLLQSKHHSMSAIPFSVCVRESVCACVRQKVGVRKCACVCVRVSVCMWSVTVGLSVFQGLSDHLCKAPSILSIWLPVYQ